MNIKQRIRKPEQTAAYKYTDLSNLVRVLHNTDGTATIHIGES